MTSYSDQTGIKLITQTGQFSAVPGENLQIPVVLTNLGSTPDQLRISVDGIPLVWVSAEEQVVLINPGEQARIILNIQPPGGPNAPIGRYNLRLGASSLIDPARTAQTQVSLTVAGFEVNGRMGVLLEGVQYSAIPGTKLSIPIVVINQGLSPDDFRLAIEGLPENWTSVPASFIHLDPGETKSSALILQPPRDPSSRASRYPFHILIDSQQAPDQRVSIDCTLTVAAFTEFRCALEKEQPDQNLPAHVVVQNLSNMPETFRISFHNPEDRLIFNPKEPQQINLPSGRTSKLEYTAIPTQRPWLGGEQKYPYTVLVQASDQQSQTLEGEVTTKGLIPTWAIAASAGVLLCLCLVVIGALLLPRVFNAPAITETATSISAETAPPPTATQSQIDQKPLLVGRNWYLVSYNDSHSSPGVQEAQVLFNPNDTLIGYTGCKDLSGRYQTSFNQISIGEVNLGPGSCGDETLQKQENAIVAILRSARSYYVADTALQVAGEAGFLNYSLTPVERPEEILPPQAVIRAAPQAPAGAPVIFDGSASTGQAPLVAWKWDFGDGQKASGVVVQHAYNEAGAYNVQLTVIDQRNQKGSNAQPITVLPQPTSTAAPTVPPRPTRPPVEPSPTVEPPPELNPPQAKISGPRGGFQGEPVEFDASKSAEGSSPIVAYSWSFGNGTDQPASPDPKVSTIYGRTGDYEVTVNVLDANGLSSNATTHITIDARLNTQVWTLAEINGRPLLPGTAITLQFLEGQLAGFGGCNTYDGIYSATDNGDGTYAVTIEQLKTSRRSCPADIMEQESLYTQALEQVNSATIQENMLSLNTEGGELIFFLVNAP